MLKRQRPSSPAPPPFSSSSTPYIISDSPSDLIERGSKRRRTVPPVLDGANRGWAAATAPRVHFSGCEDDEDDEDYFSDEEEGEEGEDGRFEHRSEHSQSEYKSTNTILRELHKLHQHRVLCSSPASASKFQPAPYQLPSPSMTESDPDRAAHPYSTQTGPMLEKRSPSHPHFQGILPPPAEEVNLVTERYESTNKLLGSLFLSRRRLLDPSDADVHDVSRTWTS